MSEAEAQMERKDEWIGVHVVVVPGEIPDSEAIRRAIIERIKAMTDSQRERLRAKNQREQPLIERFGNRYTSYGAWLTLN